MKECRSVDFVNGINSIHTINSINRVRETRHSEKKKKSRKLFEIVQRADINASAFVLCLYFGALKHTRSSYKPAISLDSSGLSLDTSPEVHRGEREPWPRWLNGVGRGGRGRSWIVFVVTVWRYSTLFCAFYFSWYFCDFLFAVDTAGNTEAWSNNDKRGRSVVS